MLPAMTRYRLLRKLGEGGMGVVYAAHDDRLGRPVAIKMIREAAADARARERLWREARSAASVSHPHVCQLYEVGEDQGQLFIAMELLEGEPLASRLARGPLPASEAVQVALSVLSALEALHLRGLVHRDLKPSNVFLTPNGVKLLDFGLARQAQAAAEASGSAVTLPGVVFGTPQYMAPEQVNGDPIDARSDLFAAGAMLYEMLTGRAAFGGDSIVQVLHAVAHAQPPVLGGSPAVAAVDRVIHRALAKRPADRYPTADAMAEDLRAALLLADSAEATPPRPMTRLIVLPFRILRPDPETDFLGVSLADAITASLSGLESLVVRSSFAGARFATASPDLRTLAAELEVDVVLTGTLLRAGDRLRLAAQLLEAPAGTVVWSHTTQMSFGDIFELQDDLSQRIVGSLSLPLTAREHRRLRGDVPGSAKAYEFYLRALQLSHEIRNWPVARDLYGRCVDEDPRYAPAWARLGRIERVTGKYASADPAEHYARAEAALRRALEINPDLPIAHKYYAELEVDLGRAEDAMLRLVARASAGEADPEVFAGLVHACRYCGLLEASIAAWEQARRLDPNIRTSVAYSWWLIRDYERVLETDIDELPYARSLALIMLGRQADALATLEALDLGVPSRLREIVLSLRALLQQRRDESLHAAEQFLDRFGDPEGMFYVARHFAYLGESERAIALLEHVAENGFFCFSALAGDPWLDGLRSDPRFGAALRRAEARHRQAASRFAQAGGERILGLARA